MCLRVSLRCRPTASICSGAEPCLPFFHQVPLSLCSSVCVLAGTMSENSCWGGSCVSLAWRRKRREPSGLSQCIMLTPKVDPAVQWGQKGPRRMKSPCTTEPTRGARKTVAACMFCLTHHVCDNKLPLDIAWNDKLEVLWLKMKFLQWVLSVIPVGNLACLGLKWFFFYFN